jgi:hypothetical protein
LVRSVRDHYVASPELRQALAGLSRELLIDVIGRCLWSSEQLDRAIHDARVAADLREHKARLADADQASERAKAALDRAIAHSDAGRPGHAAAAMAEYFDLDRVRSALYARADRAHARAMRRMDERRRARQAEGRLA